MWLISLPNHVALIINNTVYWLAILKHLKDPSRGLVGECQLLKSTYTVPFFFLLPAMCVRFIVVFPFVPNPQLTLWSIRTHMCL